MSMLGKIRRMHVRQGMSVREIARATSLSRNTVRKYLRPVEVGEPRYERAAAPTKLAPYHEAITLALKADARRPRKERRTALDLTRELKAQGYTGCYSRATDFIRQWRQQEGLGWVGKAFVPLRFGWKRDSCHRAT